MSNLLVISALGHDRPGLVNELSKAILETGCNILDSRMTVLGGEFAVMLLVDGNWNTVAKLESVIAELGKKLDLAILSRRTEKRTGRPNELPYAVEAVSVDHPGIVNQIAGFFSSRNINIEDLRTDCYPAPHTGTPMFTVNLIVGVPADLHIGSLREQFMHFCDDLNLDAVIEPVKG